MANIIVCADGTWNSPEEDLAKDHPTNILKVARAIAPRSQDQQQHVFYDWGLGSYHSSIIAGISGNGIHKNILDGYRYIVQNYARGDRIFLFGFSRGAYTVRALSGLINNCGIVKRPDANLIQEAWDIYKSPADNKHPDASFAINFRKKHSHQSRKIAFIGVWDTVGALGIPFSFLGFLNRKDEFYDTKMGPNVEVARHAIAIDERREDFKPTIWTPRKETDVRQVWFAGVHSDIGGSYPPDKKTQASTSDTALKWMMQQAKLSGLKFESHLEKRLTDGTKARLHDSRRHIFRIPKPYERPLIHENIPTRIHESVKTRYLADKKYRPKKLEELLSKTDWDGIELEL